MPEQRVMMFNAVLSPIKMLRMGPVTVAIFVFWVISAPSLMYHSTLQFKYSKTATSRNLDSMLEERDTGEEWNARDDTRGLGEKSSFMEFIYETKR